MILIVNVQCYCMVSGVQRDICIPRVHYLNVACIHIYVSGVLIFACISSILVLHYSSSTLASLPPNFLPAELTQLPGLNSWWSNSGMDLISVFIVIVATRCKK